MKRTQSVPRVLFVCLALAVFVAALAACAAPTPQVVEKEKVVEKPVPQTVVVEKEKQVEVVVTATPAPPTFKGTVVVGDWQEPKGLIGSIFYEAHTNALLDSLYFRPLNLDEDDKLIPEILSEIPTTQNGGISADGKTINLKFKDGFTWHDGKPVTSEDFKFTWQFIMNPDTKAQTTAGWNQIDSIDTPDAKTAVVHLKAPFVPFVPIVLTFPFLPKHALEGVKDPGNSDFARKPIGNGPFMFQEWVPGDHITVVAYPKAPMPAKLEKIIFKFVPDVNTLMAMLRTGDVDVAWDLRETNIPELEKMSQVTTFKVPGVGIERYYFNLRDPKDLSKPHPFFTDINVRKAISMGMDRFTAVSSILKGYGKVAVTELDNTPWFNENLQPVPYDPEAAKKLLDEAGWKVGSDGIRAKNGVKLSFRHSTTSGNQVRENLQVFFQQNLKDIGVDMKIDNYPSATLFGGCADNGIFGTGNFDMMGFTNKPVGIDLAQEWSDFFVSSAIKDCKTNPAGTNAWGLKDDAIDKAMACAVSELDPDKRLTCIKDAEKLVYDTYQTLYIYDRLDIYAVAKQVKGVVPTVFAAHSKHYNEWYVKE